MQSKVKQSFTLLQQTPMWHFQKEEQGITLRATEVKPKLDRFLLEWCRRKGIRIEKGWVIREDPTAFDYRMTIRCDTHEPPKGDMRDNHLFFGNMGNHSNPKQRIRQKSGSKLNLTILCFHKKLRELLRDCLPTFFLVTNFGTRQSKGFGSFVEKDSVATAEKLLVDWYGTKPIYKIDYGTLEICQGSKEEDLFRDIEKIYGTLKGGINFHGYVKGYLTRYFLDRNLGGEKRFMKQAQIAPIANNPGHPFPSMDEPEEIEQRDYRYIRGLLGLGAQQMWKSDRGHGKVTIQIKPKGSKIARIPSPILFKPVKNQLFILPNDVDREIYGEEFEFFGNYSKNRGVLKIPSENEFDMDEMFAGFVAYINSDEIRKRIKNIDAKVQFVMNPGRKIVRCTGGK